MTNQEKVQEQVYRLEKSHTTEKAASMLWKAMTRAIGQYHKQSQRSDEILFGLVLKELEGIA